MQTEPKLLRNGWADESTPSVRRLLVARSDGFPRRGGDGPSTAAAAGDTEAAAGPAAAPVKIGGVTLRVPGWLPTWWEEFTSDKAVMVEVISRALFPLMFFVFNAVYWPWYLM